MIESISLQLQSVSTKNLIHQSETPRPQTVNTSVFLPLRETFFNKSSNYFAAIISQTEILFHEPPGLDGRRCWYWFSLHNIGT